MFSINIKDVKDDLKRKVSLVELKGKLDMVSSPSLSSEIIALVDQGEIYFVLDMDNLEYIDSAGIYALLQCYTRLKEKKGFLKLVKLNKNVGDILSSIGVTKILLTYNTIEEALNPVRDNEKD
ncbi:MAG: STAS domain-containing protein [Candidatus Omnitrophota bacterium]|nr:STAS domain-containing protein [Candidatus Omnitrophota bacterium]